jgi:hypothetical protein
LDRFSKTGKKSMQRWYEGRRETRREEGKGEGKRGKGRRQGSERFSF